jgi:hypothetical protein
MFSDKTRFLNLQSRYSKVLTMSKLTRTRRSRTLWKRCMTACHNISLWQKMRRRSSFRHERIPIFRHLKSRNISDDPHMKKRSPLQSTVKWDVKVGLCRFYEEEQTEGNRSNGDIQVEITNSTRTNMIFYTYINLIGALAKYVLSKFKNALKIYWESKQLNSLSIVMII